MGYAATNVALEFWLFYQAAIFILVIGVIAIRRQVAQVPGVVIVFAFPVVFGAVWRHVSPIQKRQPQ
jgi:hypothetical protein